MNSIHRKIIFRERQFMIRVIILIRGHSICFDISLDDTSFNNFMSSYLGVYIPTISVI